MKLKTRSKKSDPKTLNNPNREKSKRHGKNAGKALAKLSTDASEKSGMLVPRVSGCPPYDHDLLEKVRNEWQYGYWDGLSQLPINDLECHPDKALIALYSASGHFQLGKKDTATRLIRLALEWGCSSKKVSEILLSGVHNTFARIASISGMADKAQAHYESSLKIGSTGLVSNLIAQARAFEQSRQLGLFENKEFLYQEGSTFQQLCATDLKKHLPTIRTVHHLSCTGGTLIAKCLAALPNMVVFNEVDPHSTFAMGNEKPFVPRDVISLLHESGADIDLTIIDHVFLSDIHIVASRLAKKGQVLLLRDHAHSAYLVGPSVRDSETLLKLVARRFPVRPILTVRNPIDSYLSLRKNNWMHFEPSSFDEYCRRYLRFLDDYRDAPLFRYENFVSDPQSVMREMCQKLELEFSPDFMDKFNNYNFSGDSGRSGSTIEPRPRREFGPEFRRSVNQSNAFPELAARLEYPVFL